MSLELQARLGAENGDRRYAGRETRTPEEVSDPTTIRDESTPTLYERFRENKWYLLTVSVALVILALYLTSIGVQVVPDLLANPFVQVGGLVAGAALTAYVVGRRGATAQLRHTDWLTLVDRGKLRFYPGEWVPPTENEEYALFVPYRGFSFWGHLAEPLTVADVSPDLARRWKNANRDPEDPALIRLDPDMGEHVYTEYGHVLAQLSGGLRVDAFGERAVLEATVPDTVDEGRMDDVRGQLEEERALRRDYQTQANRFRRQRDELMRHFSQPIDEILEDYIEKGVRIAEAGRRRRDDADVGDVAPMDADMAAVDEEVAPPDD